MTKDFTGTDLNKTIWVKPERLEQNRQRLEINADGVILGKLAQKVANFLIGKGKSHYCDFWDTGDFVVVQNVEKLAVSGNKLLQKMYFSYSGWKGNVKSINLKDLLAKHPERVLWFAVKGMLPKNKLRAKRLKRLKIFVGQDNQFDYFKPTKVSV